MLNMTNRKTVAAEIGEQVLRLPGSFQTADQRVVPVFEIVVLDVDDEKALRHVSYLLAFAIHPIVRLSMQMCDCDNDNVT